MILLRPFANHRLKTAFEDSVVLSVSLQSRKDQEEIRVYYHVILGFTSVITQLNQNEYVYKSVSLKNKNYMVSIKVSEYPFKENKNTLKIMQVLLYTHFYNISLNIPRPNFVNICNLPVSHFPNIRKIRVKVGPKTNYFSYFMSSYTDRIVVFNNFFSLIFSQPRDKQNHARDCLLFK